MRGVPGLALIFALVLAMLTLPQVGTFEASITTLTGGFEDFVTTLPTMFVFLIAAIGLFLVVGSLASSSRGNVRVRRWPSKGHRLEVTDVPSKYLEPDVHNSTGRAGCRAWFH